MMSLTATAQRPDLATQLADRLRLETRDLHAAAERSGVMGQLLQQRLDVAHYHALMANLLPLYQALEAALDARQADPRVAPVRLPALYRSAALANDVQALGGPLPPQPATAGYVQRLHDISAAASPALVAHAYVRYLGDLHGGQLLKRLVLKSLQLDDSATQFYEFGNGAQVQAWRTAFRSALAAVPATPAEVDLIVAEARWAFVQHQAVFEQLL